MSDSIPPPNVYRIDVVEVDAMNQFRDAIQILNDKGDSIGEASEEQQEEIRNGLNGKRFVTAMVTDLVFKKSLVINSPVIEVENVPYWIGQIIDKASKRISGLMEVKKKIPAEDMQPKESSLIILPNGRHPKS